MLAGLGVLFSGGAASAAGAANPAPASAAPCTAWNLSNDLVWVYLCGGGSVYAVYYPVGTGWS